MIGPASRCISRAILLLCQSPPGVCDLVHMTDSPPIPGEVVIGSAVFAGNPNTNYANYLSRHEAALATITTSTPPIIFIFFLDKSLQQQKNEVNFVPCPPRTLGVRSYHVRGSESSLLILSKGQSSLLEFSWLDVSQGSFHSSSAN